MPILDPLKMDVRPCICGRLSNKPHCAYCGSYDVRGSARQVDRVDASTGLTTKYHIFRCRHCGQSFDGFDWQFDCKAPLFESKSMRFKRIVETGNRNDISQGLKDIGLFNKGKIFSEEQMAKALSPEGIAETRMRLFKMDRKRYLAVYEEKFAAKDREKGIAPPHDLENKDKET